MIGIRFHWKKNIFSNTYKIYQSGKQIGFINKNIFSANTTSEINTEKYVFRQKNFLNQETEIINSQNKVIGNIRYSLWRNKATIKTGDTSFAWKYTNIWNTKWEIQGENNSGIHYSSINNSIESDIHNDLQILTGLYISNYYQQTMFVILLVLFIPLFSNAMR